MPPDWSWASLCSSPDSTGGPTPFALDLAPLPGRLRGPTIDLGPFDDLPDHDRDFAGRLRTGDYRGAHAASDLDP